MVDVQKYIDMLKETEESLAKDPRYKESLEIVAESYFPVGNEEYELADSPFVIASRLHEADSTYEMHPAVAQFCLDVYFDEYSKGNAEAACNLGSLYYTGRAGEQSYAKAVEFYTYGADHGSRQAAENLGYCYYYGRDVEKDYEKSFHYFLKGALDGHIRSLYKIGDFYKNGYYVQKDEKEAFHIYSHCADTLTDEAAHLAGADVFMRLANCYYKGIGTEVCLSSALRLYQLSESMFYERLKKGDFLIKGNLDRVIAEEEEVRKLLRASMPDVMMEK